LAKLAERYTAFRSGLLVPRLCLGMPIERLCLESSPSEAEPRDIGSQAEPRNQFERKWLLYE